MLELNERIQGGAEAITGVLRLPFDTRQKSRFRATLEDGTEVGVVLERGGILRGGDRLRAADGRLVQVEAADEPVSTVHCKDATALARLCYHLGNRHVPLQIGQGFARYRHDHVLDDMVRGLGLEPRSESAPFEPEAGAYGGGHGHGHHH
ncbi:urease accessory protein UreE [Aquisalimonas sp.]|uniref:urease accessory protein UreE n=1 Tax=Aquisalimonas sp. TaxID=1872621 RepID=UPI0025BE599F|nr:urease accessory protein UreE [Aquisalimonas sp.]